MTASSKKTTRRGSKAKPEQGVIASNSEPASNVLFEATIHPVRDNLNIELIARLDIDRVPAPKGQIRALLTADDCVRLLNSGFEVHLINAHPIRPLDRSLVESDDSVRRLLKEKLRGLIPPGKSVDI